MIAAVRFVRSLTSNRRFRGWAAAGILLLACPVPALAGPADEIPVGDPLEAELRILDVRGDGSPTGLRLPRLHTRPLQVVELADSIASTRTDFDPAIRIARARLGRALVRDLPDTLGLPTAGSSRRLWSRTGSQDDRLDFSLAGRDGCACECSQDSVAVAQTTTGLSRLDSATQSAVCLLSQILEEKGVHRALEPDVQVGDVAFGERDDIHTGERQAFE